MYDSGGTWRSMDELRFSTNASVVADDYKEHASYGGGSRSPLASIDSYLVTGSSKNRMSSHENLADYEKTRSRDSSYVDRHSSAHTSYGLPERSSETRQSHDFQRDLSKSYDFRSPALSPSKPRNRSDLHADGHPDDRIKTRPPIAPGRPKPMVSDSLPRSSTLNHTTKVSPRTQSQEGNSYLSNSRTTSPFEASSTLYNGNPLATTAGTIITSGSRLVKDRPSSRNSDSALLFLSRKSNLDDSLRSNYESPYGRNLSDILRETESEKISQFGISDARRTSLGERPSVNLLERPRSALEGSLATSARNATTVNVRRSYSGQTQDFGDGSLKRGDKLSFRSSYDDIMKRLDELESKASLGRLSMNSGDATYKIPHANDKSKLTSGNSFVKTSYDQSRYPETTTVLPEYGREKIAESRRGSLGGRTTTELLASGRSDNVLGNGKAYESLGGGRRSDSRGSARTNELLLSHDRGTDRQGRESRLDSLGTGKIDDTLEIGRRSHRNSNHSRSGSRLQRDESGVAETFGDSLGLENRTGDRSSAYSKANAIESWLRDVSMASVGIATSSTDSPALVKTEVKDESKYADRSGHREAKSLQRSGSFTGYKSVYDPTGQKTERNRRLTGDMELSSSYDTYERHNTLTPYKGNVEVPTPRQLRTSYDVGTFEKEGSENRVSMLRKCLDQADLIGMQSVSSAVDSKFLKLPNGLDVDHTRKYDGSFNHSSDQTREHNYLAGSNDLTGTIDSSYAKHKREIYNLQNSSPMSRNLKTPTELPGDGKHHSGDGKHHLYRDSLLGSSASASKHFSNSLPFTSSSYLKGERSGLESEVSSEINNVRGSLKFGISGSSSRHDWKTMSLNNYETNDKDLEKISFSGYHEALSGQGRPKTPSNTESKSEHRSTSPNRLSESFNYTTINAGSEEIAKSPKIGNAESLRMYDNIDINGELSLSGLKDTSYRVLGAESSIPPATPRRVWNSEEHLSTSKSPDEQDYISHKFDYNPDTYRYVLRKQPSDGTNREASASSSSSAVGGRRWRSELALGGEKAETVTPSILKVDVWADGIESHPNRSESRSSSLRETGDQRKSEKRQVTWKDEVLQPDRSTIKSDIDAFKSSYDFSEKIQDEPQPKVGITNRSLLGYSTPLSSMDSSQKDSYSTLRHDATQSPNVFSSILSSADHSQSTATAASNGHSSRPSSRLSLTGHTYNDTDNHVDSKANAKIRPTSAQADRPFSPDRDRPSSGFSIEYYTDKTHSSSGDNYTGSSKSPYSLNLYRSESNSVAPLIDRDTDRTTSTYLGNTKDMFSSYNSQNYADNLRTRNTYDSVSKSSGKDFSEGKKDDWRLNVSSNSVKSDGLEDLSKPRSFKSDLQGSGLQGQSRIKSLDRSDGLSENPPTRKVDLFSSSRFSDLVNGTADPYTSYDKEFRHTSLGLASSGADVSNSRSELSSSYLRNSDNYSKSLLNSFTSDLEPSVNSDRLQSHSPMTSYRVASSRDDVRHFDSRPTSNGLSSGAVSPRNVADEIHDDGASSFSDVEFVVLRSGAIVKRRTQKSSTTGKQNGYTSPNTNNDLFGFRY